MINKKELIKIIETSLELKEGTIAGGDVSWFSLWDSLGHLSILIKLDKVLDGQCSQIKDLSTANSITSIIEILKSNNLFKE